MGILNTVWRLRTDPFYPDADASGVPIPKEAIERSLNPMLDPRVVPHYFDVYDWSESALIKELSTQVALRVFPTPKTVPRIGAVMALISGSMETGLDSLTNLIVHKLQLMTGQLPLIAEIELEGRDQIRQLLSVARRIIWTVKFVSKHAQALDIVKEMEAEYERARKEEDGRKEATYSDLFMTFRELLKPIGRQLVLKIVKGGDNDGWVRIYDSLKECVHFIIVMTPDFAYAKTCYEAMINRHSNIAWIKAVPLDQAKAHQYIAERIAAGRMTGDVPALDPLLPFTREALAALFEPSSRGGSGRPLAYPIGWLRRTLGEAFSQQIDVLHRRYATVPPDELASVDLRATCIGPAEMKRAWERNNQKMR